jgi:mRNA interferase HigB
MRVISHRKLREFYEGHPDSQVSLEQWFTAVEEADWKTFADLRQTARSADIYKNCVVFDIGGNKYRLIAWVNYRRHTVYVREILTHAEYNKGKWKGDCGSG